MNLADHLDRLAALAIVPQLGWTLVHFMWQGAAIALLTASALARLDARPAAVRYALATTSLLLMALAPLLTFALLAANPASVAAALVETPAPDRGRALMAAPTPAARVLAAVVAAWSIGTAVNGMRLLGGCLGVGQLRHRGTRPAPLAWQRRLDTLAHSVGLRRAPALLYSSRVSTPVVFGCWRPVVLVPLAAVMRLTPEQLELVLLHELAHVRRGDYLINLLQSVVEVGLFFHPGVWWLSRRIRDERELCCDEAVVARGGNRQCYARALAELESCRTAAPALGATGGDLARRIHHVLGLPVPRRRRATPWLAALTAAASLLYAVPSRNPAATTVLTDSPMAGTATESSAVRAREKTLHNIDSRRTSGTEPMHKNHLLLSAALGAASLAPATSAQSAAARAGTPPAVAHTAEPDHVGDSVLRTQLARAEAALQRLNEELHADHLDGARIAAEELDSALGTLRAMRPLLGVGSNLTFEGGPLFPGAQSLGGASGGSNRSDDDDDDAPPARAGAGTWRRTTVQAPTAMGGGGSSSRRAVRAWRLAPPGAEGDAAIEVTGQEMTPDDLRRATRVRAGVPLFPGSEAIGSGGGSNASDEDGDDTPRARARTGHAIARIWRGETGQAPTGAGGSDSSNRRAVRAWRLTPPDADGGAAIEVTGEEMTPDDLRATRVRAGVHVVPGMPLTRSLGGGSSASNEDDDAPPARARSGRAVAGFRIRAMEPAPAAGAEVSEEPTSNHRAVRAWRLTPPDAEGDAVIEVAPAPAAAPEVLPPHANTSNRRSGRRLSTRLF